jgi:hypothetical protein
MLEWFMFFNFCFVFFWMSCIEFDLKDLGTLQGATASTVAWSGPGAPSIAAVTGQNAELVSLTFCPSP